MAFPDKCFKYYEYVLLLSLGLYRRFIRCFSAEELRVLRQFTISRF